ncbi:large ribosomal subunit protein uL23m isoform X5 [Canis lupus baileyi]|uniref:39S ribosomal protein L23, mitochondrial isoform X5 n=1 Tax=Canis lupus dingo TaxID=286419 RepID=UPI000BA9FC2A|nr:39S ribosomal protein L23, mitochondrial isoform X5 [Canis lupus dingo]XP_038280625.1 39S ribosomal protein L23, mitochondrial isoform X3 [Canis lupus familiaris]XP_038419510.1 39S ribosomal protein L23, mitochondrial isoform X3 [Canis lupus familiaris]|eukprot:XP_022261233.1 39S ribosomal protein L23, mitochondrial isoform X4 [Canis lupus familiaris]
MMLVVPQDQGPRAVPQRESVQVASQPVLRGKPGLGATLQPAACLWDHHFKQPWSPASLGGPWYPLYQLGNPQLRIFRTNFFIQLVRPGTAQPEDTVQFRIPMEMTRVDLRNYLERIYNVPVAAVRTRVQHGARTDLHVPGSVS